MNSKCVATQDTAVNLSMMIYLQGRVWDMFCLLVQSPDDLVAQN